VELLDQVVFSEPVKVSAVMRLAVGLGLDRRRDVHAYQLES